MNYVIQHRATGLLLVVNWQRKTDEWVRETEAATSCCDRASATGWMERFGLAERDYEIAPKQAVKQTKGAT